MSEKETLLWQLDLVWSLLQLFTRDLSHEQCLREPAPGSWSLRCDTAGNWSADWADDEPSPPPPTSIGWLLWHIGWWWSDVTERAFGNGSISRQDAPWPGSVDQARRRLLACHERWGAGLVGTTAEDLQSVELGDRCWPLKGQPFSHVAAWVNSELMKNTAEIGATLRILDAT